MSTFTLTPILSSRRSIYRIELLVELVFRKDFRARVDLA